MTVELDGHNLTIEDIASVARNGEEVSISPEAEERVRKCRERLEERIEDGDKIYGVNTGLGDLADKRIDDDRILEMQDNILKSHSVGVGEAMETDETRAMLLLRLNSLLQGNSGVRMEVVETLRDVLNQGLVPHVPRKGSVGASGDLAPLSHMALSLTGRGKMKEERGEWEKSVQVLKDNGIEPLTLREKEGLALVNGTNFMTAIGCLMVHDAERLADYADTAGALSLEAMAGIEDAFREEIQEMKPHAGQVKTAENIRKLVHHSQLVTGSENSDRMQDAYSLRCIPQVHGASRELVSFAREKLEAEANSATDNPLVLDSGEVVSGGNFHGQLPALVLDSLKNAVAELADLSERRIAKIVDKDNNHGLPPFLIEEDGLNSGLMLPQYTAASLVSENKVLTHPSSTDSIPTSANQEDHVSMGANSANHLREVVDNTWTVIAIEVFTAYQALSFREESPGKGTSQIIQGLEEEIEPVEEDRIIREDFLKVEDMLRRDALPQPI